MENKTTLSKVLSFFLTKIFIGVLIVVGLVAFVEWSGKIILDKINLASMVKNLILTSAEVAIALISYKILFTIYEKRQIKELSSSTFVVNATFGFGFGLILQSLFVLVIYITGNYSIVKINPFSFIFPSLIIAIGAGFIAEILIRGIFFRLIEEKLGSFITILILTILFALLHLNVSGATLLSVLTTAIQAGALLSAIYVFTRSLWSVIFIHFAWDMIEPGVFGGINPGNSISQSILNSKITGPALLTGGPLSPQNSIQALILCSIATVIFLLLAKKKKSLINSSWTK